MSLTRQEESSNLQSGAQLFIPCRAGKLALVLSFLDETSRFFKSKIKLPLEN